MVQIGDLITYQNNHGGLDYAKVVEILLIKDSISKDSVNKTLYKIEDLRNKGTILQSTVTEKDIIEVYRSI